MQMDARLFTGALTVNQEPYSWRKLSLSSMSAIRSNSSLASSKLLCWDLGWLVLVHAITAIWVHACNVLVVSRKHGFPAVSHCLFLFWNDLWSLRTGMRQMSHLGLTTGQSPIPFMLPVRRHYPLQKKELLCWGLRAPISDYKYDYLGGVWI